VPPARQATAENPLEEVPSFLLAMGKAINTGLPGGDEAVNHGRDSRSGQPKAAIGQALSPLQQQGGEDIHDLTAAAPA
jgi:hypothetical protein